MKEPSTGFCFCFVMIAILYPNFALKIAEDHLATEQAWSTELQEMINHDMEVVARQNHYIEILEKALETN